MPVPKKYASGYEPTQAQGDIMSAFSNLGISVVYATLAVDSGTPGSVVTGLPAGSQIPYGGGTGTATRSGGPVVHSLGVAPSFYLIQPLSGSSNTQVSWAEVTLADRSAIYVLLAADTVKDQTLAYVKVVAFP